MRSMTSPLERLHSGQPMMSCAFAAEPTVVASVRPAVVPHLVHHCASCAYVSPKWYTPLNGQTLFGVACACVCACASSGLVCLTSVLPSFLPHLSDIVRLTNTINGCPLVVSLGARSSNEHAHNRNGERRRRVIMYTSEQMSELFNECAPHQF